VNARLPFVLGALVVSSLGVSGVAEAQRARVHFSGGVRWSGGVNVTSGSWHFARPAWRPARYHVHGSIYVGPTYRYYPRPYYVYYPTYVPSYYESTSYYPVQPAVAAPGVVAVAAPERPLPRLGVGLFLGGSAMESQTGDSTHESDDLGLLARFRLTPGLIIEGELGKMSYDVDGVENARVDRRLGASLLYEIGARNRWAPYLLVGMGVQQAEVGGEFTTTQDYGEIGAGLRFAVTEKFHLAFELRAGSRATVSSEDMVTTSPDGSAPRVITPPSASSDETEEYTRARLNAVLYF
jgi:hypothetical protein